MLQKHHLFRKIVCLLMAFALLLMQTGCGTQSEEIGSSETANETADSDSETEEAKDKFVMLQEVYDILSGPLGEPYRTPEYWGGEEIDMLKWENYYLIGLRNSENQMHYFLYDKEQKKIDLLETQGERIVWEDIRIQDKQLILSSYHPSEDSLETANKYEIIYNIASKTYTYNSYPTTLDFYWETLFHIPDPSTEAEESCDFSCLTSSYQALQTLFYTDRNSWNRFSQDEICILNQDNYVLIRSGGWLSTYCLYQKASNPPCVNVLQVDSTNWEVARFQNENDLCFPDPGFKIPSAYVYRDFPYTIFYNIENDFYTIQPLNLLEMEEGFSLHLGLEGNHAPGRLYHLFFSNNQELPADYLEHGLTMQAPGFSLVFEMLDNPEGVDEIFPQMFFSKKGQQITIEIWDMSADTSIQKEIASLSIEGFNDFMIEELSTEEPEQVKSVISFTVDQEYALYGDVCFSDIPGDHGGVLTFWARK